MYKDKIIYVSKGELFDYFNEICELYKNMYNTANYYIRNTMTGIKKSPEKRFPNETEVLHHVFTNISNINKIKLKTYNKKLEKTDNKNINIQKVDYPTRDKWFLSYGTLDGIFKLSENESYINMPSQLNQNAIKECARMWKGYFNALKEYKRSPSLFTGKPKPPKYLKGSLHTAVFTNTICKIQQNENNKSYIRFPKTKAKLWLGKYISVDSNLKEVKVKPIHGVFEVHIIIEVEDIDYVSKQPNRMIGIDLGIDNFASISNNIGLSPILIKGNVMKSRNQWFNKEIAKYTSILKKGKTPQESKFTSKRIDSLYLKRTKWFRDYFHKISKSIIDYCNQNNIDTIVVGKNNLWKQEINIGNKNNQNFCYIPFEIFNNQLKYLTKENNINLFFVDESYTSKASFLNFDAVPTYRKGDSSKYSFSGKRIHRGLYKTNEGILINADINGASNILRKQFSSAFNDVTNFNYLLQPISWWDSKYYKKTNVQQVKTV